MFLKNNWNVSKFLTDYIPVILFPILYIAAKRIMGVPTISADKMDFVSNVAEFDAMTCVLLVLNGACVDDADHANRYDEPPPKNRVEALWMRLVRTTSSRYFVHVAHPRRLLPRRKPYATRCRYHTSSSHPLPTLVVVLMVHLC